MRASLPVHLVVCTQLSAVWFGVAKAHGGHRLEPHVPGFLQGFTDITPAGDDVSANVTSSGPAKLDLSCVHSDNKGSRAPTIGEPVPDVSLEQCAAQCKAVDGCTHFTYNDDSKMCHVKEGKPDLYDLTGGKTASRSCDRSCFEQHVSYEGAPDVMTAMVTSQSADCQAACAADPSCEIFTYNEHDQKCTFKGRGFSAFKERGVLGVTSGPKQFCDEGGKLTQEEMEDQISGCIQLSDVGSMTADLEEPMEADSVGACMERCRCDGRCTHFTFNDNTRMCYLKGDKMQLYSSPGDRTGPKSCDSSCFSNGVSYVDDPATDVETVFEISHPIYCQVICAANPLCTVFQWYASEAKCVVKRKGFYKHRKTGVTGVTVGPREFCDFGGSIRDREEADAVGSDDGLNAEATMANSPDFHDEVECVHTGNIGSKAQTIGEVKRASSLSECRARCQAEKECSHYTYNVKSGLCYPKRGKPQFYKYLGDMTGSRTCDTSCLRRGVDYSQGPEVGKPWYSTLPTDCQVACDAEDACLVFTWDSATSRCYLIGSGFSAHRRNDVDGVVSGPYTFCDNGENLQVLEAKDTE
uniref:Micronemal protein MIC4 n=1 Tax=Toxoplasma gondii TaxID=5811 RepID=D8L551_TOXGO|nr:micronemal protein MIC4 [Toxoplasma gondii]